jgi:GH35 family endo-1,4-beta-xylanase
MAAEIKKTRVAIEAKATREISAGVKSMVTELRATVDSTSTESTERLQLLAASFSAVASAFRIMGSEHGMRIDIKLIID